MDKYCSHCQILFFVDDEEAEQAIVFDLSNYLQDDLIFMH
jgi:hypothetical protein